MSILSYKWWWSRIGGRKWTWIMRDFYHAYPLLVIFSVLIVGSLLGKFVLELDNIMVGLVCLLLAHLFWGRKYVKGQGK